MVDVNDYCEEKSCVYKDREYLVRDNGAVLRISQEGKRKTKSDDIWTFGTSENKQKGYFEIAGIPVHRIVATAFLGETPTKDHVVDHIDTNRKNNRPINLRWLTRFENVVLNESTRRKIEYLTGTNIYDFLENLSKYRHMLGNPDVSWMRTVSEEEAKACLEKLKSQNGKSLSPLAKQTGWRIPTEFLCCPIEITGEPIECYLNNLKIGEAFGNNKYGNSTILDFVKVDDSIILKTQLPSEIKPFGLVKITYENGYFMHTNLGSFLLPDGAEKYFVLAQGLEWTGGATFDDGCL